MGWITLIIWLISFLAAGGTKSGKAGKAALIATGAAAATWYAVDPANPNAAWDIFSDDATSAADGTATAPTVSQGTIRAATGAASGWGSLDNIVSTSGKVLSNWGPTGTMGVIAGTAAVTGSGIFSGIPKWALYLGGGLLIYNLVK